MISFAHIAGTPVEEAIGSLGPALLLTFRAASATLRARLRRARSAARHNAPQPARPQPGPAARTADHPRCPLRRESAEPAAPARPLPHYAEAVAQKARQSGASIGDGTTQPV